MPSEVAYKPIGRTKSILSTLPPPKVYNIDFYLQKCTLKHFYALQLGGVSTLYTVPKGKRFHITSINNSISVAGVPAGEYGNWVYVGSINTGTFSQIIISSDLNENKSHNITQDFNVPYILEELNAIKMVTNTNASGYCTLVGYEETIKTSK